MICVAETEVVTQNCTVPCPIINWRVTLWQTASGVHRGDIHNGWKAFRTFTWNRQVDQAFFFSAGKITQAQNNSSSKITQGFFKITQGIFGKKLMVPAVFGLIWEEKLKRRGEFKVSLTQEILRWPKLTYILEKSYFSWTKLVILDWKCP